MLTISLSRDHRTIDPSGLVHLVIRIDEDYYHVNDYHFCLNMVLGYELVKSI